MYGCCHAIGIKNHPVQKITPKIIQDDLRGRFFIELFQSTILFIPQTR
jgi:hypothetical protein